MQSDFERIKKAAADGKDYWSAREQSTALGYSIWQKFNRVQKLDEGMFLFGARQTGKSTLLKERFKEAVYYDLINPTVRNAYIHYC